MTDRNRLASSTSDSDNSATKKAKHQLSVSTLEKWQRNYDENHHSLTWLKCDVDTQNKDNVASSFVVFGLPRVQKKISLMKNCSPAWITGSGSDPATNLLDHSKRDHNVMTHCRIFALPKRWHGKSPLHTAQAMAWQEPVVNTRRLHVRC